MTRVAGQFPPNVRSHFFSRRQSLGQVQRLSMVARNGIDFLFAFLIIFKVVKLAEVPKKLIDSSKNLLTKDNIFPILFFGSNDL